jgi:hypothetical protein
MLYSLNTDIMYQNLGDGSQGIPPFIEPTVSFMYLFMVYLTML